jgi:hypothetical protein
MSICWYCHWGWAKPVAEIYQDALDALGGDESPLLYGPGHIVWDDENFDDRCIRICIKNFDKYSGDYSIKQLCMVRISLLELLALSPEQRDIEPDDYDGENPQNYPPKCEVVKV